MKHTVHWFWFILLELLHKLAHLFKFIIFSFFSVSIPLAVAQSFRSVAFLSFFAHDSYKIICILYHTRNVNLHRMCKTVYEASAQKKIVRWKMRLKYLNRTQILPNVKIFNMPRKLQRAKREKKNTDEKKIKRKHEATKNMK